MLVLPIAPFSKKHKIEMYHPATFDFTNTKSISLNVLLPKEPGLSVVLLGLFSFSSNHAVASSDRFTLAIKPLPFCSIVIQSPIGDALTSFVQSFNLTKGTIGYIAEIWKTFVVSVTVSL